VQQKDKFIDWFPLHYTCQHNQSESVVLKLINNFPDAVKHKDNENDQYALRHACAKHQSAMIVMKLIEIFPEGVKHTDWYQSS
jgi:hypothetical protein